MLKRFQISYVFPSLGNSLAAAMMLFYWVQMKLRESINICQMGKVLQNIIRVLQKHALDGNSLLQIKDKQNNCC